MALYLATMLMVIAVFWTLWAVLRLIPTVFWLLLPFNLFHVWIMLCGAVIEGGGAYMRELDDKGSMVGSTLYYCVYVILFNIVVALMVGSVLRKRSVAIDRRKIGFAVNVWSTVAIFLIAYAFYRGSPLITKVDRFTFLDSVGFVPKKIYLLHFAAGFIMGLATTVARLRKRAMGGLFLWYLGVIAMGDKFSALLLTSLAFLSGYQLVRMPARQERNAPRPRKLGHFQYTLIGILLCVAPVLGYVRYHNVAKEDMFSNIVSRIAIDEGAVWHGTYKLVAVKGGTLRPDAISGEDTMDHPSGVNALMFALADFDFAYNSRQAGISFAMGYPAIVVYVFGLAWGMLLSLSGAVLVAVCVIALIVFLRTNQFWWLFLALNASYILQDILLMGRTWKLFGWQIIPLIVCAFVVALRSSRTYRAIHPRVDEEPQPRSLGQTFT